jgi:deoxyinosine 3'endonuclease (endonuclease V)
MMLVEGELRAMSGRAVRRPDMLMVPGGGDREAERGAGVAALELVVVAVVAVGVAAGADSVDGEQ